MQNKFRWCGIRTLLKPCLIAVAMTPWVSRAMEIQWTRMAGQWPVEASPLVAEFTQRGKPEVLVINRGGQLLLWQSDGTAIGAGQDGLVFQMPAGRWTTAPTLVEETSGARLLVASAEGLVVGLDKKFQSVWQHQLPGETGWGRATPARIRSGSDSAYVFGDGVGVVTALRSTGGILWTNALGGGPIKAPPQSFMRNQAEENILVPGGSTLFCLDHGGHVRWQRDLGKAILTRPEVLSLSDHKIIFCGTSSGSLFALNLDGEIRWECPTGDTLNNSITFLARPNALPLILCPGLWGNLHAIDVEGRLAWTHLFRAKTRATPVLLDADGDGHAEIFIPTFHQHVYAFDDKGDRLDDVHLSGIMPSALTQIADPTNGRADLLVTTTTLLAYRLHPGPPKSSYGKTGDSREVSFGPMPGSHLHEAPALGVRNPNGALINVNLRMTDSNGWTRIVSSLTTRSAFEIPLPSLVRTGAWSLRATAKDSAGRLVNEKTWKLAESTPGAITPIRPELLRAWPTEAYGSFDETRLVPSKDESGLEQKVALQNLYQDEIDQGAFIIASTSSEPVRARLSLTNLISNNGVAFGGTMALREVVLTGSVNGERVPDALVKLGDDGLLTIPGHRSAKIWLSVATHGAAPGKYSGRVVIASLQSETNRVELQVAVEVLNLRLTKEFPLTLCTWDYVPNRWFPTRSKEVLDDMARHGVNIFPRTTIPPGQMDSAGRLTIDWAILDAELERLQGRGKILFHLSHPPIDFAVKKSDAEKRPAEIAYILAFRDHLRERGWGYDDYAFYLLDEPGLDNGVNIPILLDVGRLFREADPKLHTYTDPVAGLSWKDFERIEPLVDVWAPNMYLVSGLLSGDPRIKRIMKAKTVWSYECFSQVKSLSPLCYNRANAWRAKFFGLGGIGFWTHSTTDVDHWFAGKTFNDEYALVYPGELPVPSVRWEAVRDGLEDVSAITLLEDAVRRQRQSTTKRDLVEQSEKALRIGLNDVMELSDEAFVQSRDFLREGDRVLGHTWTDLETFHRHRAEIARLTLALNAE